MSVTTRTAKKTAINTVKCVDPKRYNLTKDKEYDVLSEKDSKVEIVNDRGLTRMYKNTMFEEISVELTLDEIKESISVLENNDITLNNKTGDTITLTMTLSITRSHASCGIWELSGINTTTTNIMARLSHLENGFTAEEILELSEILLIKMLQVRANNETEYRWLLVSTNCSFTHFDLIDETLDMFAESVLEGHNPNSNNDISLWIVQKEDLLTYTL